MPYYFCDPKIRIILIFGDSGENNHYALQKSCNIRLKMQIASHNQKLELKLVHQSQLLV